MGYIVIFLFATSSFNVVMHKYKSYVHLKRFNIITKFNIKY